MIKIYNKLVRDNLPEIIKAEKCLPKFRILDGQEFSTELFKKLMEEANELILAKDDRKELIEEIGDVYEVIDAIMEYYKIDQAAVMKLKNQRRKTRGAFKKRIFLESVE